MLYITSEIKKEIAGKKIYFIFLTPKFKRIKVKKERQIKYMAGDLVNQAKPKLKPKIRDRSNLLNLANNKERKRDKTPKKERRLSGRAILSKKKLKGKKI